MAECNNCGVEMKYATINGEEFTNICYEVTGYSEWTDKEEKDIIRKSLMVCPECGNLQADWF